MINLKRIIKFFKTDRVEIKLSNIDKITITEELGKPNKCECFTEANPIVILRRGFKTKRIFYIDFLTVENNFRLKSKGNIDKYDKEYTMIEADGIKYTLRFLINNKKIDERKINNDEE